MSNTTKNKKNDGLDFDQFDHNIDCHAIKDIEAVLQNKWPTLNFYLDSLYEDDDIIELFLKTEEIKVRVYYIKSRQQWGGQVFWDLYNKNNALITKSPYYEFPHLLLNILLTTFTEKVGDFAENSFDMYKVLIGKE